MSAAVVYESVYGNTRAIAEAIAEGLGGATVVPVSRAGAEHCQVELLVVGGPTHLHGLSSTRSRQMAVEAAHEDVGTHVDPDAAAEPGLRAWIHGLPAAVGMRAATFDTRLDKAPWFTGVASRGIAKRLRHRGYDVIATESFLVKDSEGPLEEGELDRAKAWGRQLAGQLTAPAGTPAHAPA